MINVKKVFYVLLGLLFVGLGAIGAVLPVLPTTPFLLLSLFFFSRGSDRWNNWFTKTAVYKKYVESFLARKGLTRKQKISILLFADFMIAFPLIFVDSFFVKAMLIFIIIAKYCYFIFAIKTIETNEVPEPVFLETVGDEN